MQSGNLQKFQPRPQPRCSRRAIFSFGFSWSRAASAWVLCRSLRAGATLYLSRYASCLTARVWDAAPLGALLVALVATKVSTRRLMRPVRQLMSFTSHGPGSRLFSIAAHRQEIQPQPNGMLGAGSVGRSGILVPCQTNLCQQKRSRSSSSQDTNSTGDRRTDHTTRRRSRLSEIGSSPGLWRNWSAPRRRVLLLILTVGFFGPIQSFVISTLFEYPKPYTGPALLEPGAMWQLVERLHSIGFLTFGRKHKAEVGISTAAKKDGMQRPVFDCRVSNLSHGRLRAPSSPRQTLSPTSNSEKQKTGMDRRAWSWANQMWMSLAMTTTLLMLTSSIDNASARSLPNICGG
jgi:hypothetical protein